MKHSPSHILPDTHQSAWQLASIQMAGWTSLPILATSIAILQNNSFLGAILTIIVGNAILWFIRLGIIAMSYEKRLSTLDIARVYLGNLGGYFIAILLLVSTFSWFIAQTTTGSHSITHLLHIDENPTINQFTQVSVLLGTLSTLFCMGGIIALRRLSTLVFPFLLIALALILYALPDKNLQTNHLPLSLAGLSLVLATNLGITSDLPTFFRHSKSWHTSVLALTLVQLLSIILGICSLYFGSIITHGIEIAKESIHATNYMSLKAPLMSFIFLSVICANVANVYAASVGWEIVAPKSLIGRKEYFILGLGLTTIFILVSGLFSVDMFLQISDSSLVNLCLVLVIGYIIAKQKQRLPNSFEKTSYFAAWLLSSMVSTMQSMHWILVDYSTVLIGFIVIVLVILPSMIKSRLD